VASKVCWSALANGQVRGQAVNINSRFNGLGRATWVLREKPGDEAGQPGSPLPPLAMAGLPVVLTATRPSGWAMTSAHL